MEEVREMKTRIIALGLSLLMICAPALAQQEFVPLPGGPMDDGKWGQLLIGSWCDQPSVGSAYGERLIFTEDALYTLPTQLGMFVAEAIRWDWSVQAGKLSCGPQGTLSSYDIDGPYEVGADESPYTPKIRISGKVYYQYSPDPAYFPDLADYGLEITASIGSPKALDDEDVALRYDFDIFDDD